MIKQFGTPSRKGAEREEMIDLVTRGEYEYEPHAPEQAYPDRVTKD